MIGPIFHRACPWLGPARWDTELRWSVFRRPCWQSTQSFADVTHACHALVILLEKQPDPAVPFRTDTAFDRQVL